MTDKLYTTSWRGGTWPYEALDTKGVLIDVKG